VAKGKTYEMAFKLMGKLDNSLVKACGDADKALSGIGSAAKIAGKVAATAFAAATAGAIALGTSSVKKAMEFENSMADVVKVVDGLRDENGRLTSDYYEMSDALMTMATKIPMTTSELAAITAAAGQAGIASEDLMEFTETAAKMGIALDTTAEQAGEWMATWRTAMSLSQTEVAALGDQINYLGNTTSESALKLAEVVTRVGSLGQTAGLTGGEIAALASGMTGVDSAISATSIKSMILAMTAGSAATAKQAAVLKQLGFESTSMAERMQTDAQGAIMDLLSAIKRLPEAEQTAALNNYFGKASVEAISPLLLNLGYLEEQFGKVGDASLYAGSMEGEFAARSDTTANKVQLAQNQIENMQIKLGQFLLPIVGQCSEAFGGLIDRLAEIVEKHGPGIQAAAESAFAVLEGQIIPALETAVHWLIENGDWILALTAGIVAGVAAFKAYKIAVGAYNAVMGIYQVVVAASAAGTFTLAGAMAAVNWPLIAIVAGIAALVAIGIAVYKNWDKLKALAVVVWDKIKSVWGAVASWFKEKVITPLVDFFSPIVETVSGIFQGCWIIIQAIWKAVSTWFNDNVITPLVGFFSPIVEKVSGFFTTLWGNIVTVWGAVGAWFGEHVATPIKNAFQVVSDFVKGIFNGLIGFVEGMINRIIGAINGFIGGFSGIVGKAAEFIGVDWGGISTIPEVSLPRLATGGIATAATLAMVGEGGEPEAILPLSKLADLLDKWNPKPKPGGGDAGGGEKIVFAPVFNFHGKADKSDVEAAARASFEEFKAMYKKMRAEEKRKSFTPA